MNITITRQGVIIGANIPKKEYDAVKASLDAGRPAEAERIVVSSLIPVVLCGAVGEPPVTDPDTLPEDA